MKQVCVRKTLSRTKTHWMLINELFLDPKLLRDERVCFFITFFQK